jgi:hypothetical protein
VGAPDVWVYNEEIRYFVWVSFWLGAADESYKSKVFGLGGLLILWFSLWAVHGGCSTTDFVLNGFLAKTTGFSFMMPSYLHNVYRCWQVFIDFSSKTFDQTLPGGQKCVLLFSLLFITPPPGLVDSLVRIWRAAPSVQNVISICTSLFF